jgi:hypothetical protein
MSANPTPLTGSIACSVVTYASKAATDGSHSNRRAIELGVSVALARVRQASGKLDDTTPAMSNRAATEGVISPMWYHGTEKTNITTPPVHAAKLFSCAERDPCKAM